MLRLGCIHEYRWFTEGKGHILKNSLFFKKPGSYSRVYHRDCWGGSALLHGLANLKLSWLKQEITTSGSEEHDVLWFILVMIWREKVLSKLSLMGQFSHTQVPTPISPPPFLFFLQSRNSFERYPSQWFFPQLSCHLPFHCNKQGEIWSRTEDNLFQTAFISNTP